MVEWGEAGSEPPQPEQRPKRRINCVHCVYFRVTWDPKFPKGCTYFGFSGPEMPSMTVFKSTGVECPVFKRKIIKPQEGDEQGE